MSEIERVERDQSILSGKPVIKGTRVPVHLILELLAEGHTPAEVVEEYRQLAQEDVRAAIQYTSQVLGSTDWFEFGVA